MDLIKTLLMNGDASEVVLRWPENESSQLVLKGKMQGYLEDVPKNKALILGLIPHPLFAINLAPTLVKQSIENSNTVRVTQDVIEQILKFKGFQLDGKTLGRIFTYLQTSQIPAGFNPPGSNYKPIKVECSRQGIKLKRSDRIKYYLLLLCISGTKAIPQIRSFNGNCEFFVFFFKYLMTFANPLPCAPTPDRFLDFFNGLLNAAAPSIQLFELSELINEYIKFTESTNLVFYVLTAQKETFPAKPLESFSRVELN